MKKYCCRAFRMAYNTVLVGRSEQLKFILMEYSKSDLNWLMNKTEQCSERYMEAEKFILELAEMNWYQQNVLFW